MKKNNGYELLDYKIKLKDCIPLVGPVIYYMRTENIQNIPQEKRDTRFLFLWTTNAILYWGSIATLLFKSNLEKLIN